jgi:hypothetical protein
MWIEEEATAGAGREGEALKLVWVALRDATDSTQPVPESCSEGRNERGGCGFLKRSATRTRFVSLHGVMYRAHLA